MTAAVRSGSYAPLAIPAFRWYAASVFASALASEVQSVAVGWQLYALTGDPLSLGLIGLAGAVPFLATVLFAGHVADIANRRTVAALALGGQLACTVALLALSLSGAVVAHRWTIYAVIMAAAVARSFLTPARGALGAELVPRELYEPAVRLRSACFQIGAVCGRSGSGFVYGYGLAHGLGAAFSYGVTAALALAALVALLLVRHVRPTPDGAPEPVLGSLAAGIRHVVRQPVLLGAMILDLLGVLFGDAVILLPMFADRILAVGPEGLGLLRAAPALGAVALSLLFTRLPPLRRAGPAMLAAVAGFGLSMIGFGLSTSFGLSLALLAASGALDYVSVVVRGTLMQVLTPRHLLGRVTSVQHIFIGASNEIGSFESGVAARLMGLVPSVVFGGAMTLAVVGAVSWLNPGLRRLGRIVGADPEARPSGGLAAQEVGGDDPRRPRAAPAPPPRAPDELLVDR